MKEIKITEQNIDIINEAIKAAEGKAKARTITAADVMNAVNAFGEIIPYRAKAHFVGSYVIVNANAQEYPNAYKYQPDGTFFRVELKKSGFYLSSVWRDSCAKDGKDGHEYRFTPEAEQAILDACRNGRCKGFHMYA